MELPAQIKIFIILALIICNTGITNAQHQIDKDVTFSLKGEKGFINLNKYLALITFEDIELGYCLKTSGIIKFQLNPKGKIVSIDVEGNLPTVLVEAVKKRILLTEDKWIFSETAIKKGKNIEFYYPVYFSIDLKDKCDSDFHESFSILKKIFRKHSVLSIDNDIYIIEPETYMSIR